MGYKVLQLRRDTAANWTSNNPTLLAGELGLDSTNSQIRLGNGATAWASLDALKIPTNAEKLNYDAAYTHKSNNGSDHSYINQSVKTSDSPTFAGLTVDTHSIFVDSTNHRVGIGTTSPLVKIHVQSTAGDMSFPYEIGVFEKDGDTKFGVYSTSATASGASVTLGSSKYTMTNGNRPGFEMQHSINSTRATNFLWFPFLERNSAGAVIDAGYTMKIMGDGKVGIGVATGTPVEMLDVVGKIRASVAFNLNGTDGLASQVVVLAKITAGGANGSITITGGIVTAYTAPT
jgi:hypothetical protein